MPHAKPPNRPQISRAAERVKNKLSFLPFPNLCRAGIDALCSGADCPRPRQRSDSPASVLERRAGKTGNHFLRQESDRQVWQQLVEPQDRIATFDQDGTLWVE